MRFKIIALLYTVDFCYLEFQGTLWNTSRCPYLDISELQNWGKNSSSNICVIGLFDVRDILKILWKRGERNFFSYLLFHFPVYAGTRFSLRDKRLIEVSEVEITRVNCICTYRHCLNDVNETAPSVNSTVSGIFILISFIVCRFFCLNSEKQKSVRIWTGNPQTINCSAR